MSTEPPQCWCHVCDYKKNCPYMTAEQWEQVKDWKRFKKLEAKMLAWENKL